MKRFLVTNWALKLLSLVLAFILWFVVLREEKTVAILHAPIEVSNIPRKMMVVNDMEDLVSLKIRGAKSVVSGFGPSPIILPQEGGDSRLRVGENFLRIDPKGISVPRGIEVLGVTPAAIRVVLERVAIRELVIEPRLEGSPPQGFRVLQVQATPSRVIVKGPERAFRGITGMPTEPISVEGRTESFRTLAHLESPGDHITLETEGVSPVNVLVEVGKKEE